MCKEPLSNSLQTCSCQVQTKKNNWQAKQVEQGGQPFDALVCPCRLACYKSDQILVSQNGGINKISQVSPTQLHLPHLSDSFCHPYQLTFPTEIFFQPHQEMFAGYSPDFKSYLVFGHAPVPGSSLPSPQSQKSSFTDAQLTLISPSKQAKSPIGLGR